MRSGTICYLVKDLLGHVTVSLDTSGNVTAQQLYSPYGTFRYSHNTLPTSYSFTGQRADASGLLYFHACYYDPVLGQFTSADSVQGPNRYGYVDGNPETATDPSGHCGISKRCFDGGSFLPCGNTRNPYGGSCSDATPGNNPYWNQAVIAAQCLGMCAVAALAAVAAVIIAPELIVGAIPVAGPVLAAGLGATEIGTGTGAFIAANILLTASTLASPGVTADQQKNSVIDLAKTLILTGIFHIAGNALADDASALSSGANGNTSATNSGNQFHYDRLNGGPADASYGPSQLQNMYPKTDFHFAPRGEKGPDVTVIGGDPPSTYPNSPWPQGAKYGDFKPDTNGGSRKVKEDIYSTKFPVDIVPI